MMALTDTLPTQVRLAWMYARLTGIFFIMRFIGLIPPLKALFRVFAKKQMNFMKIKSVDVNEVLSSFQKWTTIRRIMEEHIIDIQKAARLGADAPDVHVYSLVDSSMSRLLLRQKKGRPLVISFGSCS